jgi:hypothetical protein
MQLPQSIVSGASLGSLNCKFRVGVACTSGKHAVQMEVDDIMTYHDVVMAGKASLQKRTSGWR